MSLGEVYALGGLGKWEEDGEKGESFNPGQPSDNQSSAVVKLPPEGMSSLWGCVTSIRGATDGAFV